MRFGGTPGKGPQAQRTQGPVPVQPHSTTPVRPLQPPGLGDESGIAFDAVDGHRHNGSDSHTVAYTDLTGRGHQLTGADHTETGLTTGHVLTATGATSFAFQAASAVGHLFLSATHTDTTAASCSRGALVTGQGSSPVWAKLTIGASGTVLRSDGTDIAWSTDTHALLSARHSDATAAAVARGSIITGQGASPTWARLTIGSNGQVLRSDGTDIAWSADAHNLLSARHGDTTAASATRGDLITAQGASPTWSRLAKGSANTILKMGANEPAWGSVAFSELTFSGLTAGHIVAASGSAAAAFEAPGTRVIQAGLTASRPAANTVPDGTLYLATDDDGGTLFRSNGSSWVQCGMGATETASTSSNHNLLSATHPDTAAASPIRGDIITAQGASPVWSRLAKGTANYVLKMGADEPAWAQAAFSELTGAITDAQHGALTTSSTHALGGDLSGTTAAATVAKINGKTVPSFPSNAGKSLTYDGSALQWRYRDFCMSGWSRANVSTVGTTGGKMARIGAGGNNIPAPVVPIRNGYVSGVSWATDDGLSVGGTYKVEIYINGVASGLIASGVGTDRGWNDGTASGFVAFAAGDSIDLYDYRSGALNSRAVQAQLFGFWSD